MNEKTTSTLTEVLQKTSPDNIAEYFFENEKYILKTDKPFAAYMRSMFKRKGIKQQDVFLAADISEGYGYKLIAEEKRTRQRDLILRLCLASGFSLEETQRALKIYGMVPLYPRMRRDAVLIVAINTGNYEIAIVDEMLAKHGMEPLYSCSGLE